MHPGRSAGMQVGMQGVQQAGLQAGMERGRIRGGRGGQNSVYQKWPNKIFPVVNFVFSHDDHFGLEGGSRRGGGAAPPPRPSSACPVRPF